MYQIYISIYQPQLWRNKKWRHHFNDVTRQPTQKLRNPDQRIEIQPFASFLTVSDPMWPQLTSFWPYTKLHFRLKLPDVQNCT